jgi:DNA polymerase III delta subunit
VSQWSNPPGVVILSGDESFLRGRELRAAISAADEVGRSVEYVEGASRDEISRVLSSTGIFFQHEVLLIVERPETVDSSLVLAHHASGSTDVCVLLYQEGKIKSGTGLAKIADGLPPRLVAKFDKPKPWEEDPFAVEFCLAESRRRKIQLSEILARGIVQYVGTDLGMLTFEIEKIALLLSADGRKEAQQKDVKQMLGAFAELGPKSVVDALERRDLRGVGNALANMRRTHAGNLGGATLRACAFVSNAAASWLHIAALDAEGANPEEVASRVNKHPFLVRKTLLPAARRWGEGGLTSLLKSVARVERSVKVGHLSSWVQLECALLNACRPTKEAR